MKFVKGAASGLLGFLLFVSLIIFGILFLVNQTALNVNFVGSELDKLDVAALVEESIAKPGDQGAPEGEMETALVSTVAKLEPTMKEGVEKAAEPIYDYLLGKSETIDLASTLKSSLVSPDFVTDVINELDISAIASKVINEQLLQDIPPELEFLTDEVDDIIIGIEPTIKAELIAASGPIADYLLGETQNLSIEISTEPIVSQLKETIKERALASLPPELAHIPPDMREPYIDEHVDQMTEMLPPTIAIDEALFPSEMPQQIAQGLANAEDSLGQAKQYVGYVQLGYKILIGVILLLIAGIILLNRRVRSATCKLGTIFLTYGVIEYTGALVAQNLLKTQLNLADMPSSLQAWLPQLTGDLLKPLEMFSLGVLIAGVILLIVSFVYKPHPEAAET